jgi:lipoprotein-anchoring transpeptidase ErfK/SrfK
MKNKAVLLALALTAFLPISPALAQGKTVSYSREASPGTIEIHVKERALYFIYEEGRAIRYPVAVPKAGMQWSGSAHIDGKHWSPAWAPPAIVKRDHPELPDYIAGGSPDNPMGAAALTLDRDQYAIHGTTQKMRKSIGTSASYGCIRMLNEDVTDLYQRVSVGTLVTVRN